MLMGKSKGGDTFFSIGAPGLLQSWCTAWKLSMSLSSLNSVPDRCAQSTLASLTSLASYGPKRQDVLVVMATGWLGYDRAAFGVIHCLRETGEVNGKQ